MFKYLLLTVYYFFIQKKLFVRFLHFVVHDMREKLHDDKTSFLKMDWQTKENVNDCGIFVMRHMETFKGRPMTRWQCGIINKESKEQSKQLNNLRRKYATKILLSDMNVKKRYFIGEAEEFEKKPREIKVKQLIAAFMSKDRRMAYI